MAIAFIAQALNIPLSWSDYLLILAVLLLTSKGAATVTGGGFITLAATLATMNGKVPVAGMVLLLGIDRFMSEARAITNLFGNAVATIFVAWWEGMLDLPKARAILDRPGGVEAAVLAEQGRVIWQDKLFIGAPVVENTTLMVPDRRNRATTSSSGYLRRTPKG